MLEIDDGLLRSRNSSVNEMLLTSQMTGFWFLIGSKFFFFLRSLLLLVFHLLGTGSSFSWSRTGVAWIWYLSSDEGWNKRSFTSLSLYTHTHTNAHVLKAQFLNTEAFPSFLIIRLHWFRVARYLPLMNEETFWSDGPFRIDSYTLNSFWKLVRTCHNNYFGVTYVCCFVLPFWSTFHKNKSKLMTSFCCLCICVCTNL
jgi:hypothetical protein